MTYRTDRFVVSFSYPLQACQAEMRASIAAMRSAVADPKRDVAVEETFPRLPERDACRRCPVRRPYGRI